jgi:hypothetical protein
MKIPVRSPSEIEIWANLEVLADLKTLLISVKRNFDRVVVVEHERVPSEASLM